MEEKENNRFECTIYIVPLSSYGLYVCFRTSNIQNIPYKNNSYSFDYQKNSYFILRYALVVQEGNIRKTMAARGLVNGRGPRSGRDLVFRCYPPGLLFTPPKKQKLTFWVSLLLLWVVYKQIRPWIRLRSTEDIGSSASLSEMSSQSSASE